MGKSNTKKYYLFNYVFVIGLILLFTNDHYWKFEYSNWWTGKLSDFMGLMILPMVLSYFFPKFIRINVIVAAVFFIFWKSSYSQSFIDFYNQITPIKIIRVVDYSDLIALMVLPFSFILLKKMNELKVLKIECVKISPVLLLLPTVIIFMATSMPHYQYFRSDGALICINCTKKVKYSKSEILEILSKNEYTVSIDSFLPVDENWNNRIVSFDENNKYPFYKIDTIVIDHDTITDFQFALKILSDDQTEIWINGMNISEEIPDYKVERKLRKYYKRLIKKHIKKSIKKWKD